MLEEKHRIVVIRKIEDEASQVLTDLVRKANETGVAATGRLCPGPDGSRSSDQVLRGGHDLVMVGTRTPPEGGIGSLAIRRKKVLAPLSLSGVGVQARAV